MAYILTVTVTGGGGDTLGKWAPSSLGLLGTFPPDWWMLFVFPEGVVFRQWGMQRESRPTLAPTTPPLHTSHKYA